MIFADKLIALRKKLGLSQEELAEQLSVSRQAVSKWEGAQSIPEVEKLLQLSQLFGVSVDYLLKDELEDPELVSTPTESTTRKVSLEEANAFLALQSSNGKRISLAVFVTILSPVPLLLLGAISQVKPWLVSEELAGGLGVCLLLLILVPAIAVFVSCGIKNAPYEYLEKELFEAEYGVVSLAKQRKDASADRHRKSTILGVCVCVLSPIPLLCGSFSNDVLLVTLLLTLTMAIAGVGAAILIQSNIPWGACQKLLQEGDYTNENKRKNRSLAPVVSGYWLIITAAYLAWSLPTGAWDFTWVLWPVAAVFFPVVLLAANAVNEKKRSS